MRDWQDAVVFPIPKKGDLKQCDHWLGISLLDVVGKVLGRIVQGRLQVIDEKNSSRVTEWVQERTWLCRHDFCC